MKIQSLSKIYEDFFYSGIPKKILPLTDFLFPNFCLGCKTKVEVKIPICKNCFLELPISEQNNFSSESEFIKKIWTCYEFDFLIEKLIHELKYSNGILVGKFLTRVLLFHLGEKLRAENFDLIIPVPLHPVKFRERGYNQSDVIGEEISKFLEVNFEDKILIRKKYTKTQTKLQKSERSKNVENVFEVNSKILNSTKVLLVDDVITTGSTTSECAKALSSSFSEIEVQVLSLAKPIT